MIEWFTDNCFFPASMGFLLSVVFIGMALPAGSKSLLKAGLGILALTAMLIVTEIAIVSDRESASNAVYDMAAAMRENDFDYIFSCLSDEELVSRAKAELRGATCHACRVTAMNVVEISDDGNSATVDFVAFAKASNRQFTRSTPIQRRIVLDMKRTGDKWLVQDFESHDPRAGLTP